MGTPSITEIKDKLAKFVGWNQSFIGGD
jgi:hypothetical protein